MTIAAWLSSPTHLAFSVLGYIIYKIVIMTFIHPLYSSTLRNMPGPSVSNRILGLLPDILQSQPGVLQKKWIKEHGPTLRLLGPFGRERIMSVKPEVLHQILVSDWLINPRPRFLRHVLGMVAGYGLLTVTGDEHKQMRKAMNPAFSIQALSAQTDVYYDTTDILVQLMKEDISASEEGLSAGKVMHLYEWMSKATLDIISLTAFGYKTNSLQNPHNDLAEAYENVVQLQSISNMFRFVVLMQIPGMNRLIRSSFAFRHADWVAKIPFLLPIAILIKSMYRIKQISKQILLEKAQDNVGLEDTAAKRDVMSLLVRAQSTNKSEGYHMSEEAMIDQVLTFLGAGHETTASGLAWTFWLLAKHPEAQARLRKEVTATLNAHPRPDYRTLKEMQWLDCVIMESLRLMPPVPQTVRVAAQDQMVDGYLIKKGTAIAFSIFAVNTWQEFWGPDAEDFKPERWLNLPKNYNPTMSVLSFLAGPHSCIGKTMAIIEMKAVVASLIANFEFEPSFAEQVAKPTAAITMKPQDNMPLRIKLVKDSIQP